MASDRFEKRMYWLLLPFIPLVVLLLWPADHSTEVMRAEVSRVYNKKVGGKLLMLKPPITSKRRIRYIVVLKVSSGELVVESKKLHEELSGREGEHVLVRLAPKNSLLRKWAGRPPLSYELVEMLK